MRFSSLRRRKPGCWPFLLLLVNGAGNAVGDEGRAWSVQDSIPVRYFVTDQSTADVWRSAKGDPIVPSPDGQHFFFVTRHGDLACDCNRYELHVFAVADIKRRLAEGQSVSGETTRLWKVTASSTWSEEGYPGIGDAQWIDNSTILFLAVAGSGPRVLHQLNIHSGEQRRLTPDNQNVRDFTLQGDSVLYTAAEEEQDGPRIPYPATTMNGREVFEMLYYQLGGKPTSFGMFAARLGEEARRVGRLGFSAPQAAAWKISPDQRWAISAFPPRRPAEEEAASSVDRERRFVLIDMERGDSRVLFDAPTGEVRVGGELNVLWVPDSSRAIVVNTAIPSASGGEKPDRSAPTYIVDYEIASGRWSALEPIKDGSRRVTEVGWLKEGTELLVGHAGRDGARTAGMVYRLKNGKWQGREVPASVRLSVAKRPVVAGGISVSVRESDNDPPIAVATNGSRELSLVAPDPALEGLKRAKIRPVEWTEWDGKVLKGGLMLPPDVSTPRGLPLAIQAYHYWPDRFRPDGPFPTGFAAQALAGQGIAVLSIGIPLDDRLDSWNGDRSQEGPAFVKRIDAVVSTLSRDGLIDPSRVGVVGFSRSAYEVYYALTHPGETKLAAAVAADGATFSYSEYLFRVAQKDTSSSSAILQFERQFGAGSFWENKESWLKHGTIFNVERIRTPVLFQHISYANGALLMSGETIAAFRRNEKPMEYLAFPRGTHQLKRPREREASMQATVDWLTFWLLGRERPGAEAQYSRWRQLRAQQSAQQSEAGLTQK